MAATKPPNVWGGIRPVDNKPSIIENASLALPWGLPTTQARTNLPEGNIHSAIERGQHIARSSILFDQGDAMANYAFLPASGGITVMGEDMRLFRNVLRPKWHRGTCISYQFGLVSAGKFRQAATEC